MYNIVDYFTEEYVAGPFTPDEAQKYCVEHPELFLLLEPIEEE